MMMKSGLYVIATPIGNLGDITIRALDVLKNCDVILCEDTRVTAKLTKHYGIKKPLIKYHDHNETIMINKILDMLKDGKIIALVSDAGTPLISDPGYKLIGALQEQNLFYTIISGACSAISGLVLSGMPTDQFFFAGFAQDKNFAYIASIKSSIIFFESSKKLLKTITKMKEHFSDRKIAIVREISKMFEEVILTDFDQVINLIETSKNIKGEVVLVLGKPQNNSKENIQKQIEDELEKNLAFNSTKKASQIVAKKFDLSVSDVYKIALDVKKF